MAEEGSQAKHAVKEPLFERQDDESDSAWELFRRFRDAGSERDVRELAKEMEFSYEYVRNLHWLWSWKARVVAWDNYIDRKRQAALEKAAIRAAEKQAAAAAKLQEKAMERLEKLLPAELDANNVLKYFVEGARLEREALGIDGKQREKQGVNVNVVVNNNAAEEAAQERVMLMAALEELRKRKHGVTVLPSTQKNELPEAPAAEVIEAKEIEPLQECSHDEERADNRQTDSGL